VGYQKFVPLNPYWSLQ